MAARRALAKPCRCTPDASFRCADHVVAYAIALRAPQTIFDIAVQYAFSGYSALVAAAGRGVVLEGQHEVGSAREHALDGQLR